MSVEKFGELIHHCIATHGIKSQGGRELRLQCDKADKPAVEAAIQAVHVQYNFITDTEFEFIQSAVHNGSIAVFVDDKAYVNNTDKLSQNFDTLSIVILQHKSGFLYKNPGEAFSDEKALFWRYNNCSGVPGEC